MSIRKHIPNAITSCNLLSGVVGLFFAFSGRPDLAFLMMLAASVFDFFDGFAARLLKVSSPIGAELDSLSDAVSFGVLPAVMLSILAAGGVSPLEAWSWKNLLYLLPLLFAAFSSLRLAKFNLDERQHSSFLGLPTPASALLCGSLAAYCSVRPDSTLAAIGGRWWVVALLAAVLSALLVSEIPFFSFKGIGKKSEDLEGMKAGMKLTCFACLAVVTVILTVVLGWHWTALPFGIALAYVLENLILTLFKI